MKNIFLSLLILISSYSARAQTDSNFFTRIINFEWMPDGKSLILGIMKFDKSRRLPPARGIFLYHRSDKKIEKLIVDAGNPAPSPNGETIAFVKRTENKNRIYLYDTKSKKEKELTNDTTSQSSPQWSPDGKSIVFTIETGSGREGLLDIYTIDLATQSIKLVAPNKGHKNYNPVWSPDGKRIVYYLEKGDNRDQIYLTDKEGSFQKNITNDTATHNFYPSWYNDKILYSWSPDRLATIKTDGTNREVIGGIRTYFARFNSIENKIAYIQVPENLLMILDMKNKISAPLIDNKELIGLL